MAVKMPSTLPPSITTAQPFVRSHRLHRLQERRLPGDGEDVPADIASSTEDLLGIDASEHLHELPIAPRDNADEAPAEHGGGEYRFRIIRCAVASV